MFWLGPTGEHGVRGENGKDGVDGKDGQKGDKGHAGKSIVEFYLFDVEYLWLFLFYVGLPGSPGPIGFPGQRGIVITLRYFWYKLGASDENNYLCYDIV